LYIGNDLHGKQMTICIRDESGRVVLQRQVSTRPAKVEEFLEEVHRLGEGGQYVMALEVCGFHDWLVRRVYEPTDDERQDRQITSVRQRLGRRRTQTINQIRHILRRNNLEWERPTKGFQTKKVRQWLKTLALDETDRLEMDQLLPQWELWDRQIAECEEHIAKRFEQNAAAQILATIVGVSCYLVQSDQEASRGEDRPGGGDASADGDHVADVAQAGGVSVRGRDGTSPAGLGLPEGGVCGAGTGGVAGCLSGKGDGRGGRRQSTGSSSLSRPGVRGAIHAGHQFQCGAAAGLDGGRPAATGVSSDERAWRRLAWPVSGAWLHSPAEPIFLGERPPGPLPVLRLRFEGKRPGVVGRGPSDRDLRSRAGMV
jgi:hypothetical protein